MKKTVKAVISVSAAACFLLPLVGCDKAIMLESPTEFNLDENYNLTWSPVENARSYIVDIKNVNTGESSEATSRRENVALSYLDMGDYDIRVRAVGDGSRFQSSDWSTVISFDRAYESGCRFQLINSGSEYELVSVSTSTSEIILEDSYRGKPVTSIGKTSFRGMKGIDTVKLGKCVTHISDGAFYNCTSLKSISIPDTVTSIGAAAFQGCASIQSFRVPAGVTMLADSLFAYCKELKEVDFNNVTEIGSAVFNSCPAIEVFEIPDGVEKIGSRAFAAAPNLKEITFGGGLASIGASAFADCENLDTVHFSESGNLKSIGMTCFKNCGFTSIDLPDGLESIGSEAFRNASKLESATIPESVTIVGSHAFYGSKLYNDAKDAGDRLIYADNWLVDAIYKQDDQFINVLDSNPENLEKTQIFREDTIGIADRTFAGYGIGEVKLSKNIKYVGASSFNGCPELYLFDASESALEIVDIGAFAFSPKLQFVFFDTKKTSKLKDIANYAFYNCEELMYSGSATSSRFIPESVEHIGAYAFYGTKLYEKDIDTVIYADDWIVGCTGEYIPIGDWMYDIPADAKETITLDNVRGIADYAFYNCKSLRTVENSAQVVHLGRGAFYGCNRLTSFVMNTNLKVIDDYAFYGCSNLMLSRLPTTLQTIGRAAFYGCEQLEKIDMPSRLTSVGDFAFYGCKNMTGVSLGSGIGEIGEYTFYGCNRLESVTIPANVKKIGKSAFSGCTSLAELTIEEGVEEIGDFAFRSNNSLTSIELPDSVKKVGDCSFLQCESVERIDLGSVEEIGDFAFAENFNVKSLVVPESVKTIGQAAFYYLGVNANNDSMPANGCSVIISGSPEKIEAHAFYGCNFTTIYANDENRDADWGTGWNSSRRPTIWGVTLSEDKSYVVSITINENTFENYDVLNAPAAPQREGYEFAGWSLIAGSSEVAYTILDVVTAPVGTTLYAVYIQHKN